MSQGEIALDYKIYRTGSAVQFTPIRPNKDANQSSNRIKPGSLLIEIAKNAEGQGKAYDWENKIKIALSVQELGKLCLALGGQKTVNKEDKDSNFTLLAEFVHDPNIGREGQGSDIKSLSLSGAKGKKIMYLSLRSRANKHGNISIPLGPDDAYVLKTLATKAITKALGW